MASGSDGRLRECTVMILVHGLNPVGSNLGCTVLLSIVLLYADDTIILSNTAAGLQKLLNDLESYCTMWKLRVNGSKTKVVVFGKRKPKIKPKFLYKNEELELVEEFKYLGVVFSCNAAFKKHKMCLKDQAIKAMFALLSKGRKLKLPVDIMLDLFDKTVLPVLLYGCEVLRKVTKRTLY